MSKASHRLSAIALALGLAWPALAGGFSDIPERHPLAKAAALLAERGILPGATATDFVGNSPINRYEQAEILNALLDRGDVPYSVVAWSDVPPGHPSMQAVTRVTSLKLMQGEGGKFNGFNRVSRLEFVEALDRLLQHRAASPLPRRKGAPHTFSDIPTSGRSFPVLDRAANVWQFVESPGRRPFRPMEAISRFDVLSMLVKVAPLVEPALEGPIALALATPAPTPTPTPSAKPTPWASTTPVPTLTPDPLSSPVVTLPSPSPEASPQATPTPTPKPGLVHVPPATGSLFANRARAGFNATFLYYEGRPEGQGLASPNDGQGMSAIFPGTFNPSLSGSYWTSQFGGTAALNMIQPIPTRTNVDLLDLVLQGEGYYRLPWRGPHWEAGAGGGLFFRLTNGSGADYFTTGKTYFGLGPAGIVAYRPAPRVVLTGSAQVYPALFQSYSLSGAGQLVPRFGAGYQLGGEYEIMPFGPSTLTAGVYYRGFLATLFDGSGVQTQQSLTLGAGGSF